MNKVTIISSAKNWLEQKAVDQLNQIAMLPGVMEAVGLPDLHPGKTPVGAVLITQGIIYPHIIGNDLGCGMSLYATEIDKRRLKLDKMVKKLETLHSLTEIELPDNSFHQSVILFNSSLGTIGRGNHFAELQEVATINDIEQFNQLGLNKDQLLMLIHSGSRGYGQSILVEYLKKKQPELGLQPGSAAFEDYITKHDDALKWACLNRDLIGYRFLKALGAGTKKMELINSIHNSITLRVTDKGTYFIHRKGAAPADQGMIVIPGSRGSLTYLVMPTGDLPYSGYSLAHGAGRKWERSLCEARLKNKYTKESIKTTRFKSKIICNDPDLLFEEAPESYKNIDTVIQSFVDLGLLKVIATFKPILTYKN